MRRLVLIVMMCLLPLQWSWAAAASLCEHESGSTHFGHHEHKHVSAADATPGDAGGELHEGASWNHPDCQSCHGVGAAVVSDALARLASWTSSASLPAYRRVLPEPPVASLLRPPLNLVA
jgi:hypothetical protein